MSKLIPNTTQFPNVLLEEIAPILSAASLRVLIAIVRKTYGFHRRADRISFKQLEKLTGLSRVGVNEGIKGLVPLLIIRPGRKNSPTLEGVTSYEINIDVPTDELVSKLNQYSKLTSKKSTLELVRKAYSPKENTKEEKSTDSDKLNPALSISCRLTPDPEKKNRRAAPAVPADLLPVVSQVIGKINELAGTAYKPDSRAVVNGLVQRLRAGASEADCLAVVEHQWQQWRIDEKMRQYFDPETLFREVKFDKYLNRARMGQNGATGRLYGGGGFVG